MVGRTPEYLGNKIEAREVKLAALTLMIMLIVLVLAALAIAGTAQTSVQDAGPHGFPAARRFLGNRNTGSAFAGFNAATPWH